MLCGRLCFGQGPWHEATIGAHGEYLLSLSPVDSVDTYIYDLASPHFELKTMKGIDGVPKMVKMAEFNLEECVFLSTNKSASKGVRLCKRFFKTASIHVQTEANQLSAYVAKELHSEGGFLSSCLGSLLWQSSDLSCSSSSSRAFGHGSGSVFLRERLGIQFG